MSPHPSDPPPLLPAVSFLPSFYTFVAVCSVAV